ncbi:hypothetical protein QF037_007708 [Streptomyces canus]|uniref:hypothetical protein n=1 Tax=Streptomyces canus TaxID=58343 RepID=UPI002789E6ED|nr:hypothetical protein [Streptomyces canus]MDQ0603363.1 hypothetical protein [Streptomyces canus]
MADDRPVPLDEYPVHQVPLSMKHVATGDRNAYDRCIFHVLDHEGRALLIVGLGVYPNLGVIDAYATLRVGDTLHAVRASDALGEDRMRLAVGPLRIEVERPLHRLRLVCDDDSLSYDLTWTAAFPALWEPRHVQRRGARLTLEGRRFVGCTTKCPCGRPSSSSCPARATRRAATWLPNSPMTNGSSTASHAHRSSRLASTGWSTSGPPIRARLSSTGVTRASETSSTTDSNPRPSWNWEMMALAPREATSCGAIRCNCCRTCTTAASLTGEAGAIPVVPIAFVPWYQRAKPLARVGTSLRTLASQVRSL